MRKENNWRLLICLGGMVLFVLIGCKKDHSPDPTPSVDNEPAEERCYTFDSLQDCGGLFHSEIELAPAYKHPAINPNNPNEFCYYLDKQVFKHDMSTGQTTLLADDLFVISRMDWGASGWITFSTRQWKVWKLKDDGSELTQLSFTPRDLGPEFSADGNQITYARSMEYSNSELQANPGLRNQYKIITIDLEGNEVDSFCRVDDGEQCYPWLFCSLSPDGSIYASHFAEWSVRLYDRTGARIGIVFDNQEVVTNILDIEWHPDGERLFFATYGIDNRGTIYVANVNTNTLDVVKEGCDNRFYTDMSISPDGSFMLVQKGTAELAEDNCDMLQTLRIVRMDIDGGNEEVVELD